MSPKDNKKKLKKLTKWLKDIAGSNFSVLNDKRKFIP